MSKNASNSGPGASRGPGALGKGPNAAPVMVQMPPLPDPLAFEPASVKQETTYPLPDRADNVVVGGGGRFLVFSFPNVRKLGIFDVNQAKLTQYIDLGGDKVYFAAGMNKLILYRSTSGVIQRYNFLTGAVEGEKKLQMNSVSAFCMGSASEGPLLINATDGLHLLDIGTFDSVLPAGVGSKTQGFGPNNHEYWASANGRLFAHRDRVSHPSGAATLVVEDDNRAMHYDQWWSVGYLTPSPDGKFVYPCGYGVMTNQLKVAREAVWSNTEEGGRWDRQFLPAHHGPYYMHFHLKAKDTGLPDRPLYADEPERGITFYKLGDVRPLVTLKSTNVPTFGEMNEQKGKGGFDFDKRMHLIPRRASS